MYQIFQLYPLCEGRSHGQWGNLHLEWHITIIDDKIDSFDIDTSSEKISGDEKSGTIAFEKIIILNSFLLLEIGMNADRIENFLFKEFGQFLGAINSINKNDGLIEC